MEKETLGGGRAIPGVDSLSAPPPSPAATLFSAGAAADAVFFGAAAAFSEEELPRDEFSREAVAVPNEGFSAGTEPPSEEFPLPVGRVPSDDIPPAAVPLWGEEWSTRDEAPSPSEDDLDFCPGGDSRVSDDGAALGVEVET